MGTVSIVFAKTLAKAAGCEFRMDGALVAAGKTVLQVTVDQGKISPKAYYEILDWIAQKTPGRAALAIRYAEAMDINHMGPLGLAYKAAPDLRGAFQRHLRYSNVLSDSIRYHMDLCGPDVLFRQEMLFGEGAGLVLTPEAGLSVSVAIARQISSEKIDPQRVFFTHKPSIDADKFAAFFNCEVQFNARVNGLLFSNQTLDTPNRLGDAGLSEFLAGHLDQELASISQPKTLAEKILNLVSNKLAEGVPKAADIAIQLGMSERTLHRRLADDGQSYRDLCDSTRKTLASNLLRNTPHSLSEIAFLTGFSEQSAFNRAFKRWQGQTPAEFRGQSEIV